jgi:quercetin dioxygenase-like cupin family protein
VILQNLSRIDTNLKIYGIPIGYFDNISVTSQTEVSMKIANLDTTPKIRMNMEGAENVQKQIPISGQDGSPSYAFRVFTIEPGGHTPYHTHAFEHLNYIIEGAGVVVMSTGEERPVKQGDFVLVLPGEKHQYKNTSASSPFVMICAVPKEYE